MTFSMFVFFFSFLGLVALFGLKYWELRAERVLAPHARLGFDKRALQLKELLLAGRRDLGKLPPLLFRMLRYLIHEAALGFAALARMLERQAHRLADLVSHKHRFERRETRSEFLKKVSEHVNESGLDTTQ